MTAPTRPAARPTPVQIVQTHPCVRCGDAVPLDVAMCERCNPLGLPQPASSQAHGTVALGIIIAVVVLAVLGRVAIAGVGPFTASVVSVAAAPPNLAITLTVRNDGTREGQTTCRVFDPAQGVGIGPNAVYLLSPQIGASQTLSFSKVITGLGAEVRPLSVACQGP